MSVASVVDVRDLSVRFASDHGEIEAVDAASFDVREGEILGLVGESGSGKTVTATAILRLIRKPGRQTGGSILFDGRDLSQLGEDELQQIRGARIAMISQTPRTSLNPLITVGAQVARLFQLHAGLSPADSRKRALEMLTLVGIPEPERRARQYAHQFSGGMCQRVAVMHAGQVVEVAPVRSLFRHPAHPYTRALVRSIPRIDREIVMEPVPGSVPSLLNPPAGCRYAGRCPWVEDRCRRQKPAMTPVAPEHFVACFAVEDGRAAPV